MTYTFFFPFFYSATQFNEAKRWFESATVLCRFVPDGVAKAEKVRDGCLFSTPEHYHYFEGALHDLDPGGSLVRGHLNGCNFTFGSVITRHLFLLPHLAPSAFLLISFFLGRLMVADSRSTRRIRICCLATSRNRRMVP